MCYIHCSKEIARRLEEENKMLYLHNRPEMMNKGAKFQSMAPGLCLVCKIETGIVGARHADI